MADYLGWTPEAAERIIECVRYVETQLKNAGPYQRLYGPRFVQGAFVAKNLPGTWTHWQVGTFVGPGYPPGLLYPTAWNGSGFTDNTTTTYTNLWNAGLGFYNSGGDDGYFWGMVVEDAVMGNPPVMRIELHDCHYLNGPGYWSTNNLYDQFVGEKTLDNCHLIGASTTGTIELVDGAADHTFNIRSTTGDGVMNVYMGGNLLLANNFAYNLINAPLAAFVAQFSGGGLSHTLYTMDMGNGSYIGTNLNTYCTVQGDLVVGTGLATGDAGHPAFVGTSGTMADGSIVKGGIVTSAGSAVDGGTF